MLIGGRKWEFDRFDWFFIALGSLCFVKLKYILHLIIMSLFYSRFSSLHARKSDDFLTQFIIAIIWERKIKSCFRSVKWMVRNFLSKVPNATETEIVKTFFTSDERLPRTGLAERMETRFEPRSATRNPGQRRRRKSLTVFLRRARVEITWFRGVLEFDVNFAANLSNNFFVIAFDVYVRKHIGFIVFYIYGTNSKFHCKRFNYFLQ